MTVSLGARSQQERLNRGGRAAGSPGGRIAVGLALVLGRFDWQGLDFRTVLVMPLAGFLMPLLAVALYVAFRIRPDELFSSDPAIAADATMRLRGRNLEPGEEPDET